MNYFVKTPETIQQLFPIFLWKKNEEKCIYLTFDDGPIPNVTEWVLNILEKYNAKATFFCLGNNALLYPKIYARIIAEGHSVGNHSMNHENGWRTNTKNYLRSITDCSKIVKSTLFRPPYGKITPKQIMHLKNNYKIAMWDIMPGDFDLSISPQKCFERITKNTTDGSIIVLHDSIKAEKNLRYTLPKVLEYYSEKGFSFKSL